MSGDGGDAVGSVDAGGTEDRELADLLQGCLEAVEEEVASVRSELERRGLDRPLRAEGGRLVEGTGPGFRYDWTVPAGLEIRPDDGVRVRLEGAETFAFVVFYDRGSGRVRLAVSDWLGRRPGPAELEFDPTWLLAGLAGRLEAIAERPDRYHPATALRLLGRRFPSLGRGEPRRPDAGELNAAQREALERLLGSDAHFVWGPPGTGKTRLLGHAVAELAEEGRVLVVATTNGALDEAAARVAASLGEAAIRENRVVRMGAEFSHTGDPRLSLASAVERRVEAGAGGIVERLRRIEERLGAGDGRGDRGGREIPGQRDVPRGEGGGRTSGSPPGVRDRLARLAAAARTAGDRDAVRELDAARVELQKQGAATLRGARIVLSTLAGLAVRDELAGLRFDSVVIDEASAAPLPYVTLAACLARRRAVAIGDFQQLPAVVVSRGPAAERWLSRDAFREAGVVDDAPPGELPLPAEHDRLCAMLVEQYRMAPPIRRLVSDLFYGGRLRDAPEVRTRPGFVRPLVLLDTASLGPRVERVEGSRANEAHAGAVLALLEAAAAAGVTDVAVVAPYRLQTRRVRRRVRGRLGRAAPRKLEVSTIHRFQGREKSVVVFDTVDAPPDRSWFLNESRNRDLPRLLNVALSRTRDMLVVVGTAEGLARTLPEDALLNRLVARVRGSGTVVDAEKLAAAAPALFERRGG